MSKTWPGAEGSAKKGFGSSCSTEPSPAVSRSPLSLTLPRTSQAFCSLTLLCTDVQSFIRAPLPELPGPALDNQISFKHRCSKTWERSKRERGKLRFGARRRKHRGIFSLLKPGTWSNESRRSRWAGFSLWKKGRRDMNGGCAGWGCALGAVVVIFVLPPRPQRPASPRTNSSPWFSFSNDNAALSKDPTLPKLIFWQCLKCKLLFKQTKTPKHFVLIFANNNSGEGGRKRGGWKNPETESNL